MISLEGALLFWAITLGASLSCDRERGQAGLILANTTLAYLQHSFHQASVSCWSLERRGPRHQRMIGTTRAGLVVPRAASCPLTPFPRGTRASST